VATFEEILAAARKDEQYQPGILGVGLQNHASRIINDPQFQRVQGRMQQDQEELTKRHIEETTFQNNIHNLAVTARIPRADLDYLVNNLQRPPPPPPPAPPNYDVAADRERLLAELDQRRMEDARKLKIEQLAMVARMDQLASRQREPMQQIINQFAPPAPAAIAQPMQLTNVTNNTITQMATRTGNSVHHIWLRMNPQELPAQMPPPGGPRPPPPPGGQRIARPLAISDDIPDAVMAVAREESSKKVAKKAAQEESAKLDAKASPPVQRKLKKESKSVKKTEPRLPGPDLQDVARQRMREMGVAAAATSSAPVRRILAMNKRAEPEPNVPRTILRKPAGVESAKRRRIGARPPGPQMFNIDT